MQNLSIISHHLQNKFFSLILLLSHYLALSLPFSVSSFPTILLVAYFTLATMFPLLFLKYFEHTLAAPPSQNIVLPHTCMAGLLVHFIQISVHIASYRVAFLLLSPLLTNVLFFLKQHRSLSILLSCFIFLHITITPQCFLLFLFY